MSKSTAFTRWLDTFVDEKGLDREFVFGTLSAKGTDNRIPLGVVLDAIKGAPKHEQAAIKTTLVKIDFVNGNPMGFFHHLSGALAVDL